MSRRDIALALFVMALWGGHYTVIRIGALEIPPFMLMSIRCAMCAMLFLPFAKIPPKKDLKNIALYALTFKGLHMTTLFLALSEVDSGLGSLIMKIGIPFSILIGWFIYKEKFGIKTSIGIMIALLGGFLMLYSPAPETNISLRGIILLLISALFWAIGSARLKYIKDVNFPTMIAYGYLIPVPLVVILSMVFENNHIQHLQSADTATIITVLTYQVTLMPISHYLWKNLISNNPIYAVSPFTILSPAFALIGGMWLLNEQLSITTIFGAAVALTGVTIVTLRQRQKAMRTAP